MLGLALALKATTGGQIVAIPAILLYNVLLRKVDTLMALWKVEVDQKQAQLNVLTRSM